MKYLNTNEWIRQDEKDIVIPYNLNALRNYKSALERIIKVINNMRTTEVGAAGLNSICGLVESCDNDDVQNFHDELDILIESCIPTNIRWVVNSYAARRNLTGNLAIYKDEAIEAYRKEAGTYTCNKTHLMESINNIIAIAGETELIESLEVIKYLLVNYVFDKPAVFITHSSIDDMMFY